MKKTTFEIKYIKNLKTALKVVHLTGKIYDTKTRSMYSYFLEKGINIGKLIYNSYLNDFSWEILLVIKKIQLKEASL